MKHFTLILSFVTLISFSSCNDDDNDVFDFTGTWKLKSLSVTNGSINNNNDINLTSEIEINESCLANEFLIIKPDGTATINSGSKLEVSLQLIAGTEDEFEQKINCVETESTAIYSWATGDYSVTNPDGSITTGSSPGYHTIRLLDENNETYISGFVTPGNELTITMLRFHNADENQTVEVNGETIEIIEFRGSIFEKQ